MILLLHKSLFIYYVLAARIASLTEIVTSNCTFDDELGIHNVMQIICDGITNVGPMIDEFLKVTFNFN